MSDARWIPDVIREHKVSFFPSSFASAFTFLPFATHSFPSARWNLPRLLRFCREPARAAIVPPGVVINFPASWKKFQPETNKATGERERGSLAGFNRRIFAPRLFAKMSHVEHGITIILSSSSEHQFSDRFIPWPVVPEREKRPRVIFVAFVTNTRRGLPLSIIVALRDQSGIGKMKCDDRRGSWRRKWQKAVRTFSTVEQNGFRRSKF